jgi:hypothetical protein
VYIAALLIRPVERIPLTPMDDDQGGDQGPAPLGLSVYPGTFTSADRGRDVIHGFNADGFDPLCAKYAGGRPKTFTLRERREVKKIAKSKPGPSTVCRSRHGA